MASTDPRRTAVRRRWAVPVAVAVAIGLGVTASALGPQLAAATGEGLAPRTAAGLIADVRAAGTQPLSGTVHQAWDLGLPALPTDATAEVSTTVLLAGPRTANVWLRSATEQRIAVLGPLSEIDVLRDGRDLWVWDSSADTADHLEGNGASATDGGDPSGAVSGNPSGAGAGGAGGAGGVSVVPGLGGPDAGGDGVRVGVLTPPAAAAVVLGAPRAQTAESLAEPVRVAGRPAYELVLAPTSAGSLVGRVTIDIDAATSVPLRVRVYARGASDPTFSTTFSAVHFEVPDETVFDFTPPAGATVPSGDRSGGSGSTTGGATGTGTRTAGESGRAAAGDAAGTGFGVAAGLAATGLGTEAGLGAGAGAGSRSTGSSSAGTGTPTGNGGSARLRLVGSGWTGVVTADDTAALEALLGPSRLTTLLAGAPVVHGAYGRGRLLRTPVFTALVLADGRVFAGAVTPAVLERTAAL